MRIYKWYDLNLPEREKESHVIVHPLTTNSFYKDEYIQNLKEDINNSRKKGEQIIWLLDSLVRNRKVQQKRKNGGNLEQFVNQGNHVILKQLRNIDEIFGIYNEDGFLVSEEKNPLHIYGTNFSNNNFLNVLDSLKFPFVKISGEIYYPKLKHSMESMGCVNNVAGACLEKGIVYSIGTTFSY